MILLALKLPEALVITDNARGDTQLPLRSSIINDKPIAELIASESGQGSLDEYFPIVTFHFKTSPAESKEASANVKHVLIGPVKSYEFIRHYSKGSKLLERYSIE